MRAATRFVDYRLLRMRLGPSRIALVVATAVVVSAAFALAGREGDDAPPPPTVPSLGTATPPPATGGVALVRRRYAIFREPPRAAGISSRLLRELDDDFTDTIREPPAITASLRIRGYAAVAQASDRAICLSVRAGTRVAGGSCAPVGQAPPFAVIERRGTDDILVIAILPDGVKDIRFGDRRASVRTNTATVSGPANAMLTWRERDGNVNRRHVVPQR